MRKLSRLLWSMSNLKLMPFDGTNISRACCHLQRNAWTLSFPRASYLPARPGIVEAEEKGYSLNRMWTRRLNGAVKEPRRGGGKWVHAHYSAESHRSFSGVSPCVFHAAVLYYIAGTFYFILLDGIYIYVYIALLFYFYFTFILQCIPALKRNTSLSLYRPWILVTVRRAMPTITRSHHLFYNIYVDACN